MEIAKIALVVGLLILLIRLRLDLGLALIGAALSLGFLSQMGPGELLRTGVSATLDPAALNIGGSLLLIMALCRTMDLNKLVASLKGVVGDSRVVAVGAPTLVGLMPMVGGAYFSAPLVEEASSPLALNAEQKTFINYWYRHSLEFIWPLHVTFILAAELFRKPMLEIVVAQIPLFLVAVVVAVPFSFSKLKGKAPAASRRGWEVRALLAGLSPILAVLLLALAFNLPMALALAVVVLGLLVWHRYSPRRLWALARDTLSPWVVSLVLGVVIFQGVLKDSGMLDSLSRSMAALGLPIALVFFTLPFAVGLLTGYTPAFAGIAFPILAGFGAGSSVDPYLLALAFVGGVAGIMYSPAHLCFLLTVRYFRADPLRVYRLMLVPQLAVILAGVALYLF